MKYFINLVICLLLGSCVANNQSLPQIDLSFNYPKKDIELANYLELKYIKLETHKDAIISSNAPTFISKDYIVIASNDNIMVFNGNGKYVNTFNNKGRGANEYFSIVNICVDFNKNEIFVQSTSEKILVYSFDGEWKRNLSIPAGYRFGKGNMLNYNNDYLIVCDDKYLDVKGAEQKINKQPYFLLSKIDGQIKPLALSIENRYGDIIFKEVEIQGKIYTQPILLSCPKLRAIGGDVIISEFVSDTIYRYSEDTFFPLIGLKNRGEKKYLTEILANDDRYTIIRIMEKKIYNEDGTFTMGENKLYMSDRKKQEVYEIDPPKAMIYLTSSIAYQIPEGYNAYSSIDAHYLIELYSQGKLSGRLNEIASTMKEEDNPILILGRFID